MITLIFRFGHRRGQGQVNLGHTSKFKIFVEERPNLVQFFQRFQKIIDLGFIDKKLLYDGDIATIENALVKKK